MIRHTRLPLVPSSGGYAEGIAGLGRLAACTVDLAILWILGSSTSGEEV